MSPRVPISVQMSFYHFDPLNSKYDIIQFKDVPANGIFRHQKGWKKKIPPYLGVEYFAKRHWHKSIKPDDFVLLVKDREFAVRIAKKNNIHHL